MESETKFVPQWLQAKQNDSTPNGPSRGADRFFMAAGSRDRENGRLIGNGMRPNNPVKYQLAEHRYGREEMLALFDPSNTAPDDLSEHPVYVAESLNPISFIPMTEEEEVLSLQSVNSYGYKPYLRGGAMRGGVRGDYGRGRGRGRDDEGRLKPRDPWDERPSKSQDYPGHDDGPTTPHKTDFFSPSSHHSSFNRSNSNESWRSRNNFQDADNGDYRKDRWPTKGWRDAKGPTRLQEEGSFFKGTSPRDQKPTDFRRSKSLYEEDETANSMKMPEWSTVDKDDLGVEGSFDSSGAFMTSKLKEKNKKAQDDSDKNDPAPTPETKSDQVKVDSSSKAPKSPPEAHLETVLTREDDNNSNVNLPVATPPPASSNVITPAVKILPTVPKEETDQNVLFSNMKIDDPCASLVFHANDGMSLTRNANVGASFVHPISHPASLPAAESGGILAHSSVVHPQPFNYMRNSWYYVDPQGAIQGPFRDSDMAEWYYQGYFDMTLMLKAGEGGEFVTLGAFVSKVGSLPFAPNRPLVPGQPQPVQNLPQTPHAILNHAQHPVSTLSHDVLPQTFFYPRQPLVPHLQQQPMQSPEPPSNSFLPAMHLGATNAPNPLFVSGSVHMSSLNGDVPNTTAWNQTQPSILQDKNLPEAAFNSMLPQNINATNLWNQSLLLPSSNTINNHGLAQASTVQEKIQVDYHVQQLEKMEADKEQRRKALDNEQLAMIEKMVAKKVLVDAKVQQRKKLLEEQERKELLRQEEMKLHNEQLQRQNLEEEKKKKKDSQMKERHPDLSLLELRRQEEGMNELRRQEEAFMELVKQQEVQQVDNLNEEEFKPVEDAKKLKENKKRKEAKKQEEAKRQEEIRREEESRLELVRKVEEQKKAEEMRRKEEEEQILKMRLAAEEAKRKELEEMNLRKQTSSKNAWSSSGRSQSSSKPGVPKINEIQSLEQEKMKQQHMTEQKLIADQQKQLASSAAKATGSIWKANPAKASAPKSLLDIQMEQASQLEAPVKVQQQQQVAKAIEPHPPSVASRIATKEAPARVQETGKDSAWEAAVTSGLKKHQKPPTLDNNQFPALLSAKSSATGKKAPLKALGKSAKDEIAAQKVFEAVKVKDELTEWCEKSLAGLKTEVDISTLVDFLKSLKNSSEILEYIHNYLGDSKVVKDFAKQFIEKMNNYSQENSSWSVVGRQGNGSNKTNDKSGDKANKKGKKKQQKVDANFLLGFTVHADPDRTNVGEIDAVPSVGTKK